MRQLKETLTVLILVALVFAATAATRLLVELQRETAIRTAVTARLGEEITELRRGLLEEAAALRRDARAEISALRRDARLEVAALRESADRQLTAALAQTDALRQDVAPVLEEARLLLSEYRGLPDRAAYATRWLWDCETYSGCLQSQTLALVGSARFTLGQVARAAPRIAEAAERAAESSAAATDELRQTAANLKTVTSPGRKWVRHTVTGLQILVPSAQFASQIGLLNALRGTKLIVANNTSEGGVSR